MDQTAAATSTPPTRGGRALLSVVTPAYNEAANLPLLYERLAQVLAPAGVDWEWIVVDDHSGDATLAVVRELAARDRRIRGIRLAHNSGSHTAITCGLQQANGGGAVIIAADLQDPPEVLPELLREWRAGAHVVWAVRNRRPGESLSTLVFARLYYFLMRRVLRMNEMPATGADFFFLDRRVLDALREFGETHVSLMALITWMGFRQATIRYDKQERVHGRSGWTLRKKFKLLVDSVTSFTYLPIRLMSYLGFLVAALGFCYAIFIVLHALKGSPVPGWASLMVVVLLLGGVQMVMLGVLGEYLWRALDEARRRPRYLIEETTDSVFSPLENDRSDSVGRGS